MKAKSTVAYGVHVAGGSQVGGRDLPVVFIRNYGEVKIPQYIFRGGDAYVYCAVINYAMAQKPCHIGAINGRLWGVVSQSVDGKGYVLACDGAAILPKDIIPQGDCKAVASGGEGDVSHEDRVWHYLLVNKNNQRLKNKT